MVKPYEAEVRFFVPPNYRKRLEELGFRVTKEYSFTDHFFEPFEGWKGNKSLRARDWGDRCEILFDSVDIVEINGLRFKRSKYPEGKVKLFEGSLSRCLELLGDMQFRKCGEIRKEEGYLMTDGEHTVALEKINGKYVLEIEVEGFDVSEAFKKIEDIMNLLDLKEIAGASTREIFGVCQ